MISHKIINLSNSLVVFRTPFFPLPRIFDQGIAKLLHDPNLTEAIHLSSPNLADEIKKYFANTLEVKEKEKLELSVYRYYLRSCYRCTPFGMFAGISLGSVAMQTRLQLSAVSHYQKNTRFDTHFLSTFVQQLIADPIVRSSLKWFSNNTLYSVGDKLRFIEYRLDKDTRVHHLTHVDHSNYVQSVLERAQRGATLEELSLSLVNDEIGQEETTGFINEMISSCLLVSELEPRVTGVEYHIQLLEKLENIAPANSHFQKLRSAVKQLDKADSTGVGLPTDVYTALFDEIKSWPIDFDPGRLLQCDLLKPTEHCQINSLVTEELNRTLVLLDKITSPHEQTLLKKFVEEFEKRYEVAEIPLLKVLDADTGIGYPVNELAHADNSPLLNNLALNVEDGNQPYSHTTSKWSKFILQKYQKAIKHNSQEIVLTEVEIEAALKSDMPRTDLLPDSLHTLCSLLAPSWEEVDKGNFLVYHEGTSGPSAANFLGRFCYMDAELTRLTRDLLEREELARPDCVFAEILHIAQARLGNILMRPILRKYEIPILTPPAVDKEHTIALNDLMVSIRNGRIFLRSKRLNKEVIPRLTTAHNFSMNPVPHYHFLCDLQFQGIKSSLSWNWGMLNEFSFLPRVRYGKTILSKARWIVNLSDLSEKKDVKEEELIEPIKSFFQQNNIPNRITISQGDNQLPIDIQNKYCLKILVKDLKKYETLTLQECLFNENNLVVQGPEGKFTNEMVIPWYKQSPINNGKILTQPSANINSVKRTFQPGSEWHYIKIYCGVKTADKILTEILKPIIESLFNERIITKWFFIRYADPEHHIRIRFSGIGIYYAEVTERLNKALTPYLEDHLLWKIQTDSYNRELERYGPENIENSEALFYYDSNATMQILSLLERDEGDELRWQFALKGVDDLLNSFSYDLLAKRDLMEIISNNFTKEFNADNKESRNQLSLKYRETKGKIHFALQNELEESHEFYSIWQIFKERSKSMAQCVVHIDKLYATNKLSIPKSNLIASYIHMFLNRFLRSKQRLQEMVIYYLLHQHYRSLFARESEEIKRTKV